MTPPRPGVRPAPLSTYRLQLGPRFTFRDASDAVPRLASLGVTHLHLSPILQAAPGSTHGYDVVDHTRVSAELGGEDGLLELADTAHAAGLGTIADIVPNHMAVPAPEWLNRPLWSVLRAGPASPAARWFDIDWDAQHGRVLLPVLGGRVGDVLGELRVESRGGPGGEPVLRYHEHAFPLRDGTAELPLPELLERQHYRLAWWRLAASEMNQRRFFTICDLVGVRVEDPDVLAATHALPLRLLRTGVIDGFRVDHPDGLTDPRGYLRRLADAGDGGWTAVEKILTGDETLPEDWPVAGTTGYDSLRRIDGVFLDPRGTEVLEAAYAEHWAGPGCGEPGCDAGCRGSGGGDAGCRGSGGGDRCWQATARRARDEHLSAVGNGELAAEVARLVRLAEEICRTAPRAALRDHAPWALRAAITGMLAAYPRYRGYPVPGEPPTAADVRAAETAHAAAREALAAAGATEAHADTADSVRDMVLGRLGRGPSADAFPARFAQVSAALTAKAVEDTAFYRWCPLASRNEVGGGPGRPPSGPAAFHAHAAHLASHWPTGLTALTTHDTKRSADVRARLAVLAELPQEWTETCRAWSHAAAPSHHLLGPAVRWLVWQTAVGAWPIEPERLVGAVLKSAREAKTETSWTRPHEEYERQLADFARAVASDPGPAHAVEEFVRRIEPHARANVLGAHLVQLVMPGVPDVYQGGEGVSRSLVDPDNRRPVDHADLAERLARLDAGNEPKDLSDEKIAVTAAALRLRRALPGCFVPRVPAAAARGAAAPGTGGGPSRTGPGAGTGGGYAGLSADGPAAGHVLAFTRGGAGSVAGTGVAGGAGPGAGTVPGVAAVVTRLPVGLERSGGWRGTVLRLPPGRWTDTLTGRRFDGGGEHPVALADLLERMPVALLRSDA